MNVESNMTLPAGAILKSPVGSYQIIRVIGQGGFGITYEAESVIKHGNIDIAVKFAIKEHFIKSICERDMEGSMTYPTVATQQVVGSLKDFISEAKRLEALAGGHPNIVKVNEVFKANNTAYYVMEYLDGVSLKDYIAEHGALSEQETMSMVLPVIDAVCALHDSTLTHLDIKPDNIMLTRKGNVLSPVLIDFGLAKHYDAVGAPTSTINTMGCSHGYSPIEQYAGITKFSPTADVYALGATIYHCLTGNIPPKSTELRPGEIRQAIEGKCSPEFCEAVCNAMQTSAYQRTQSARQLYNEIIGLADGNAESRDETIVLNDKSNHGPHKSARVVSDSDAISGTGGDANDRQRKTNNKKLLLYAAAALIVLMAIISLTMTLGRGEKDVALPDTTVQVETPAQAEAPVAVETDEAVRAAEIEKARQDSIEDARARYDAQAAKFRNDLAPLSNQAERIARLNKKIAGRYNSEFKFWDMEYEDYEELNKFLANYDRIRRKALWKTMSGTPDFSSQCERIKQVAATARKYCNAHPGWA